MEGVRIVGFDLQVVYVFANCKSGIARKRPGCGSPGQNKNIADGIRKQKLALLIADYLELGCYSIVFYIAVAAGLIEFMSAKPGTGGR